MDPEQSVKGTKKAEGSPRKRLTKGEAVQASVSAGAPYPGSSTAAAPEGPVQELLAPQPFPGPSPVLREGSQEKAGQQQKPSKRPSIEASVHISQLPQHPLTPAFMSPGKPEHLLEGSTWQLVDPMRPGPSSSFLSPGLHPQGQLLPTHASIIPPEDLPGIPKVFVPRPSQVPVKPTEEAHKKERKPQKPGKYICQYCSRPCAKPSVLQKHIRSHTGERPYPCGPCGFSFKTKSNLYKHRKSHAHRIKAGLASGVGSEMYPPGLEMERIPGEEFEEPTEGESTDSEEETGTTSAHHTELSPRPKHPLLSSGLYSSGSQGSSHERCSLSQSSSAQSLEDPTPFAEPSSEHPLSHKPEDTHTIKQKLALRLSERKKVIDEQAFLSPGSKGSTESGYFSRSESAEQQASPPNTSARSYAEIIFGKCGRIGQRAAMLTATSTQPLLPLSTEDKPSLVPLSVPRTQVIEHITKLITINEAVVDTSEIDSVKPRRSSLSRRSSMESPKSSLYREPLPSHGEKTKPEQSPLSLQHPPSTTPPVPLLRSHSMPSAPCTLGTPHHTFRGSYSFDDHIADSEALGRSSQVFTSHPRTLKRQPAIELPLGGEFCSEEAGPSGKDTAPKPAEEPEPKESELTKKTKKGLKTKGVIYECNTCGARYKKRDNYEAHKKYYCSELQITKPVSAGAHVSLEAEKSQAEHEPWSQMMHYKLGNTLELTPLRKRRKEKSLGDEEEPPAFESTKTQFGGPRPSDAARSVPPESAKSPAEPSKSAPSLEGPSGFQPRTPKPGPSSESGKERRATSKEISVIQHTSSFEKSDSLEQPSGLEGEDKSLAPAPFSSPPPTPHGRPAHSLQPKLVRQPNIQVPEILVTEEPDRQDTEPEPPPKEPEKTEEFQWPQRSQTLAQLPAEKLPPKKKRLRLAEVAQSSGESSFESSVPLSRSPSQESSVSLSGSSRSASFERDDHGRAEAPGPSSDTRPKPTGTHMLTVPSHHPHAREMRRSASEQSPNVSHAAHMTERRSKSFDCGSLSLAGPAAPALAAPAAPAAPPREEKMLFAATSHGGHMGGKSQVQDRPPLGSTPPYTEALQVFPRPGAQLPLHEKPCLPPPVSLFSFQHLLQHEPGQSSDFFSTQAMSSLLSSPYSMPPVPPSLFQAPPLPLQPTVLHPGQLHVPQLLPHPASIPFRQPPSFLPMPYPSSSALSPGFYLPLQSQFALQLPGDVESRLPQIKTSPAPLATGTAGLSPSTEYSSDIQLPPVAPAASSSAPTSAPPLALPACPDAMVSLVVPVRIQTNMPSYGSAMYTTLSQILVTQSQGSSATVALPKFKEPSCKGTAVCGADMHEAGPGPAGLSEELSRGFQTPYLRVPVTVPDRKGTPLSSESVLSLEGSSSTVGGSKRVLSPAGSLELTMETQQQKRVKEEEASKADEKLELKRPPNQPSLKKKVSKETYTMATAPHPETGRLVPSSSRKPRMTEVHLPSLVSPEGQKDIARVEKEEEKRGKPEEDTPASKRGEPARIKIFEGGYKSNEEYVYVRGRGRGKYVCEECGIRCKKPSMLKKHIRTHTDVRPYVCEHCHFAFKTKGNLTKHMKSKAHSKKCQETGVLEELEAEEGTSDDPFQDSEGREGSEAVAEHRFSDLEDSGSDSDLDDDEDEDEDESQDEPPGPSSEAPLPRPPASLPADSSPVRGPWPPDATSGSQATRGGSVSEAGGCSTSSQSVLCLPRLGPALPGPVEKDTSSALSSKALSPRRPWSPGKEASSRSPLAHKHPLTKSDSSPQRHSPAREPQASARSPPGSQTGPLPCESPRLELSPLSPHPLRRELPPRVHLPPEHEGTADPGTPRHSPTRRPSPGQAASPPRSVLLGKWALAGPGSPSAGECGPRSGLAPRALYRPAPLPHKLLGRSPETCASTWQKAEPRSPSCSPGPAHPISSRPFSAPHDFHGHTPARTENVFSHLPLHSQHLARAPCPLIPIGGIQMVQARPGAQPTLLPGPTWVSGFSGGGSDLTGAREAQERGRWSPTESSSASVSPVAKVSKFTLSSELEGRDCPRERDRTSRGPGRPPDQEACEAGASAEPAPTHSPHALPEAQLQPPQGRQAGSWSPHVESPHTLASRPASAAPPLDCSSPLGCLAEATTRFPAQRRNLSGEPRTSQGPSEPSGSGGPGAPAHQPEDRDSPST
ncbi:HIVEP zinc finger 3 [Phyllostomus discolor]|uniref:Transcription factor HIVEP3 n=1 Tax=Phyllostomus discolor TaxID=89673 RepID=A0A834A5T0_9CHIR|nr:HIVEP zinc finger 3 [Phyllostomus discolor]